MPGGIEIPIGAPLDQLTRDLGGAQTKLKQFEGQVNTSLSKAGSAANGLKTNFTGLNRVIQDLPFGFIAISNNLEQIFPAAGALGLGFSVLISGLSFLSIGTDNWTQGLGSNKKAIDALKQSGDEYAATLDAVAKAQLTGTQDAQKDLTNLHLLYKAYQDANLPLAQRKDAYEQLQKLYPAYFGNIKFEAEATDKTTTAYNKLTTAILATARADAARNLISQNATKQLENESKARGLEPAIAEATQERLKAHERILQIQKFEKDAQGGLLAANVIYEAALNKENELLSQRRGLITANNKLTVESINLEKDALVNIGKSVAGKTGGKASSEKDTKLPTDEWLQRMRDKLRIAQGLFINPPGGTSGETGFLANMAAKQAVMVQQNLTILNSIIDRNTVIALARLKAFNDSASQIINDNITQTFEGLGNAIGSALSGAGNVFQNLGALLLSSLGSILGQLGQMAIATGVAILGIKTALKTLNPFVAIAAGVALIALSGAVRGAANRMGNSIGGGGGSAASPGSGVSVGSVSSGSSQSFGDGRVVFEISGVNLIGVLNRAGAKLSRYGG